MMPNSYLGAHKTRFVFAGSNQAKFEVDLNDTYTPLIRYVFPLNPDDALLFLKHCIRYTMQKTRHSAEENQDYANNVPREMVKMADYLNCHNYTSMTTTHMTTTLNTTVQQDSPELAGLLDSMFGAQSHGYVLQNVSFLDLGYIYRKKEDDGRVIGYPLCYPANLALLQLWMSLPGNLSLRLEAVKHNGDQFEDYIWRVLSARVFSSNSFQIKCRSLGYNSDALEEAVIVIPVPCRQYCVSSIADPNGSGAEEYQREVVRLREMARTMAIAILYKCPDGGDTVDFIIFREDGKQIPIQVSISSFGDHPPPDKSSKKSLLRLDFDVFLYVTVKPEPHPGI
jgi:hypothetical protein